MKLPLAKLFAVIGIGLFVSPVLSQTSVQQDSARHYFILAQVNSSNKEYSKAITNYRKSIQFDDGNPSAWNNLGVIFYRIQKFDSAIVAFNRAIAIAETKKEPDKKRVVPYLNLGLMLINKKEYEKAIEIYETAIKLDPSYPIGWNDLGHIYLNLKQYDKAIEYLNKALEIYPNLTLSHDNLAAIYRIRGDYTKAIEEYKKILSIDSTYLNAHNWLKYSLYKKGDQAYSRKRWEEAASCFEGIEALDPNYQDTRKKMAVVYTNLGTQALDAKEYAKAIDYYNHAVAKDSSLVIERRKLIDSYLGQARIELDRQQWDAALEKSEIVIGMASGHLEADRLYRQALKEREFSRGLKHLVRGEYSQAYTYFDRVLQIDPSDIRAKQRQREALAGLGAEERHEQARNFYQLGLSKITSANFFDLLEAKKNFQKAAELAPSYEEPTIKLKLLNMRLDSLATVYADSGYSSLQNARLEDAKVFFESALKINSTHVTAQQGLQQTKRAMSWRAIRTIYAPSGLAILLLNIVIGFIIHKNKNRLRERRQAKFPIWKDKIDSALSEAPQIKLGFIPKADREYVSNRYLEECKELDIFYNEHTATLELKKTDELYEFKKLWDEAKSSVVEKNDELFDKSVILLTQLLCEVLGFKASSESVQLEGKVGIFLEASPFRLNVPERFSIVYFSEKEFIPKDVLDTIGLLRAMGVNVNFFALLVAFENYHQLRQLVQESVYRHDFIVLDRQSIWQIIAAKSPLDELTAIILEQVDLTKISPYVSAGPVSEKMYFGRSKEEKTILQAISEKNFAVVGGRKIGKTSLLYKIERVLSKDPGYLPLLFDLQAVTTYDDFLRELSTNQLFSDAGENGAYGVPAQSQKLIESVSRNNKNRKIVILLDEVDELLAEDIANHELLFRTFRKIAQRNLCRFIFSGSKTLVKRIRHSDSPFFNFCQEMRIGVLEERYAKELIVSPMRDMGIAFEDENLIIKNIIELSSCHPNIIQYVCQELIARINEKKRRVISAEDFDTTIKSPKFYKYFLDTIWGQSTAFEKLIVYLMLEQTNFGLDDVRRELTKRDLEADHLQDSLDALELYSILDNKAGKYELVFKSLPRLIRQNSRLEDLLEEEIFLLKNGYMQYEAVEALA